MKILRRNYSLSQLWRLRKAALGVVCSPRKMLNLVFVRISSLLKLKKNLGLPVNILIEPTATCNYRCIKCEQFTDAYSDDGIIGAGKDMPFDHYERIIDEIGDTLITLRLWNYGEPLLHKDLFRMIASAKRKGIFVAVSSNASLLDQEASRKAIESGLDYLIVSCDGASERTYALCHGKDYFAQVTRNIETLLRERKLACALHPFVELQFVVMRENEGEMTAIADLARRLGVDKLTYIKLQADRLDLRRLGRFTALNDILPKEDAYCYHEAARSRIRFCSLPWEETVIRYSGSVIPCCFDLGQRYTMGEVFHEGRYRGFKGIWNNDAYRHFRSLVAGGLDAIPLCSGCEKRNNNINDQITILVEPRL